MKKYVLILILLLTGCSTTHTYKYDYGSKQINEENISKIQRGKTTQTEVLSLFGEPMMKMQSGALGTMWTYSRSISNTTYNFFAVGPKYEAKSYSLTITFDNNGIVKDYTYTEMNPIQQGTISTK